MRSVILFVIITMAFAATVQAGEPEPGQLNFTAGGGINWISGEALLVLAGPFIVLPTAWIAWRMIRKSYG